jgi:hypothetical protein
MVVPKELLSRTQTQNTLKTSALKHSEIDKLVMVYKQAPMYIHTHAD